MESKNKEAAINIYSQLMSQVIFISMSGVAAGIAMLQIGLINNVARNYLLFSFIPLGLSLISGIFCLTTILGQADEDSPDIHAPILRKSGLATLGLFFFGTCAFIFSLSYSLYGASDSINESKLCVYNGSVEQFIFREKSQSDVQIPMVRQ